jgi:hypothetical protein
MNLGSPASPLLASLISIHLTQVVSLSGVDARAAAAFRTHQRREHAAHHSHLQRYILSEYDMYACPALAQGRPCRWQANAIRRTKAWRQHSTRSLRYELCCRLRLLCQRCILYVVGGAGPQCRERSRQPANSSTKRSSIVTK